MLRHYLAAVRNYVSDAVSEPTAPATRRTRHAARADRRGAGWSFSKLAPWEPHGPPLPPSSRRGTPTSAYADSGAERRPRPLRTAELTPDDRDEEFWYDQPGGLDGERGAVLAADPKPMEGVCKNTRSPSRSVRRRRRSGASSLHLARQRPRHAGGDRERCADDARPCQCESPLMPRHAGGGCRRP